MARRARGSTAVVSTHPAGEAPHPCLRRRETRTFDVFNILNASDVLRSTDRYGSAWLNAVQTRGGRLMKVGAQLDF